jgi:hypothetical protein
MPRLKLDRLIDHNDIKNRMSEIEITVLQICGVCIPLLSGISFAPGIRLSCICLRGAECSVL